MIAILVACKCPALPAVSRVADRVDQTLTVCSAARGAHGGPGKSHQRASTSALPLAVPEDRRPSGSDDSGFEPQNSGRLEPVGGQPARGLEALSTPDTPATRGRQTYPPGCRVRRLQPPPPPSLSVQHFCAVRLALATLPVPH